MINMNNLNPCRVCNTNEYLIITGPDVYQIICTSCSSRGPKFDGSPEKEMDKQVLQNVVDVWNNFQPK